MARMILVVLLVSLVSYGYSSPAYYNVVPKQKVVAPVEVPVPVPVVSSYKKVDVPVQVEVPATTAAYGRT